MKALFFSAVALAALALSGPASADDIRLGAPGYGGTGCPGGTASVTLGPDGKSLSLLFDQYEVSAGGSTGRSYQRKSCNLAIPVHVPNGYSMSVISVDYRGFNHLPPGARSQFNVEYFFAGGRGPAFRRSFFGPQQDDFFINNPLTVGSQVWSRCGTDVILRTNASLRVNTVGYREASATIDSQDIQAAIVYHFQLRPCR